jgi:hypothetical protein
MPLRTSVLVLAMCASLGLAACHRGSEANEHSTAAAPVPKGATGTGKSGTAAMGGPGIGLHGGLGPSGSASQPTGVAEGSTNRTQRGSVGNR